MEWNVDRVRAPAAHEEGFTGKGIKIAVLSTGIDRSHPDLENNVQAEGFSAFGGDYFHDENGLGTHLAGTIAKVAPDASVYSVKVLNNTAAGYLTDILRGLEWAIAQDMDIMCVGLSGPDDYSLEIVMKIADHAGILVIASAGDDGEGENTVRFPAGYDSVVAVAATDNEDERAHFSSTGSAVELSAPGVNIESTYPDGRYVSVHGTSIAVPHVAGVAALMWQQNPDLSHVKLRQQLRDMADPLGHAHHHGHGLVQYETQGITQFRATTVTKNRVVLEWDVYTDISDGYYSVQQIAPSGIPINFDKQPLNVSTQGISIEAEAGETFTFTVRVFAPDDEVVASSTITVTIP